MTDEERRLLLGFAQAVRYLFAVLIHERQTWRNTAQTEMERGVAIEKLREAETLAMSVQYLVDHLEVFARV